MSFGMQVLNENGEVFVDTRNKMYYTIHGRMVARRHTNFIERSWEEWGAGMLRPWYINTPTYIQNNPANYLMVLKLTTDPVAILTNPVLWKNASTRYMVFDSEQNIAPEIYVYARDPNLASNEAFGLQTWDNKGKLSFSTDRRGEFLDVRLTRSMVSPESWTDTYSTGGGTGIILSAIPYTYYRKKMVDPYTQAYENQDLYHTKKFFLDSGRVRYKKSYEYMVHSFDYPGGTRVQNRISMSIVAIPTWQPPVISWNT